jgi:hypothetical protein
MKHTKKYGWASYAFITLQTDKYIVYKYTYTVYTVYIYIHSTNDVVINYIGWGCQSLNSRKYTVLNGNFVFNLCEVFKEHKSGAKKQPALIESCTVQTC